MSINRLQPLKYPMYEFLINSTRRQLQTSTLRLSEDIFHVQDEADFKSQILESKKPFLVDFQANWCGPCKLLERRLEKLITNFNNNAKPLSGDQYITLAKVDVDKFGELSSRYNIKVVPTVLAIKNGKEIGRFTGLIDEDRIETILDKLND